MCVVKAIIQEAEEQGMKGLSFKEVQVGKCTWQRAPSSSAQLANYFIPKLLHFVKRNIKCQTFVFYTTHMCSR